MRLKNLLPALLLLAALTACSLLGSPDPLEGTSWALQSYRGAPPIPGRAITAVFKDGRVGGSSGCNSYGGSYQVKGEKISIGEIGMTEMACMDPVGVMDQEQAYLQSLGSAQTFELSNGQLVIYVSDHEALTFVPQE